MSQPCSSRLQRRSHRSYCRRKVTIDLRQNDEWSSTIQRAPKRLLHPSSLIMDTVRFVPFVDNRLYFDPNSLLHVAASSVRPQSLEYAVPSPRRNLQRHHHHHHHHHSHHHHHHRHHRKHRRVVSDPGTRNWDAGNEGPKRHRRMFSFDTGITGSRLLEASSNEVLPPDEANTSTFRKVPWHPNLHMLKIRRT